MSKDIGVLLQPDKRTGVPQLIRRNWQLLVNRQEFVVFVLLLLVCIFLGFATDTFFTTKNFANLARSFSWIAIIAFGECIVIIIGGIDLSVGAVVALAGLISAYSLHTGLSVPLAIVLSLLTGALIGSLNGSVISRLSLPPFIVTLGTMSIVRGLALGLTGGWPIRSLPQEFRMLGQYDVLLGSSAIPLPFLIMLGLAVLMSLLLNRTVLAGYIYTLGNSERALQVSGVNPTYIKILVYSLCGALAAVGGLLLTARLGVAAPTAAQGYELDIIAAAVIGGVSLFGGRGSILGVLLGAAFMQVLRNGIVLLGFPSYWQSVVTGTIILGAILLDSWRRRSNLP